MRNLRLLVIALATIFVLALGALALVTNPPQAAPADDVIIIKGGSLEIQCGKNHGKDCFGNPDLATGKYKAKKTTAHVTNITIRNVANNNLVFYSSDFDPANPPQIEITYKDTTLPPKP